MLGSVRKSQAKSHVEQLERVTNSHHRWEPSHLGGGTGSVFGVENHTTLCSNLQDFKISSKAAIPKLDPSAAIRLNSAG